MVLLFLLIFVLFSTFWQNSHSHIFISENLSTSQTARSRPATTETIQNTETNEAIEPRTGTLFSILNDTSPTATSQTMATDDFGILTAAEELLPTNIAIVVAVLGSVAMLSILLIYLLKKKKLILRYGPEHQN